MRESIARRKRKRIRRRQASNFTTVEDWRGFARDYHLIRDSIARAVPGFENFNERLANGGSFYLANGQNDDLLPANPGGDADARQSGSRAPLPAGVIRAGFYRFLARRHLREEQIEVRSAIQPIALDHRRRYGYRRVCEELRNRGMQVGHKRVLRLTQQDT